MSEQRRVDVVPREPLANERRPGVDDDVTRGIDFLDPRHAPTGERQLERPATVSIRCQAEPAWQRAQFVAIEPQPLARSSRPVDAAAQGAMDFLLVTDLRWSL